MFRNHVSVGSFDCDSFVFVFKALLVFEDPDPCGNSYEGFCRISLNSDVFVFLMSRLGYEFCAKIKTKQTRKTHREIIHCTYYILSRVHGVNVTYHWCLP